MKKLLLLTAILITISYSLLSQDRINPEKLFSSDTLTDIIVRNNNNFLIGLNWGGIGKRFDEPMYIDFQHMHYKYSWGHYLSSYTNIESWHENQKRIIAIADLIHGRSRAIPFNAHSLHLNPTLKVDSTKNFKPRYGDETGSVFGFRFKRKGVILDSTQYSDPKYGLYILYKDSITTSPDTVLKNIWRGDVLKYINYTNEHVDLNDTINGQKYYLSINLKAFNRDSVNEHLDDTILTIRVPYIKATVDNNNNVTYSNDYAKFDSIPRKSNIFNVDITDSYSRNLGFTRRNELNPDNDKTNFYITGRMLRTNVDCNPITLSAFLFFNKDSLKPQNNPHLKPFFNDSEIKQYITNLDIEVIYRGKLSCGISWIRFETPRAQEVFRGKYDKILRDTIFSLINILRQGTSSPKIYRFYAMDEIIASEWQSTSYFNKLVDNLAATETGDDVEFKNLFDYNIGLTEFWKGNTPSFLALVSLPYIKNSYTDIYTGSALPEGLGYSWGYASNCTSENDSLNSDYESFVLKQGVSGKYPLPITDNIVDFYDYNKFWIHGILHNLETQLYHNYFKQSTFLYSKLPWYANIWAHSENWYHSNDSLYLNPGYWRPKTGEELRLLNWQNIILGAKGLIYYRDSMDSLNGMLGFCSGNFKYETLTGKEFIFADRVGPDFLIVPGDSSGYDSYVTPYSLRYDRLGHDINRIYLGRQSTRTEVYKTNEWLKSCDTTLMKMKLACWYGKGFLTWYSQDTETFGTDTILKKFISLDHNNLYTKKIFNSATYSYQQKKEAWDSSFFDITILRDSADYNLTSDIFYIGLQNRRSDPLIYFDTVERVIYVTDPPAPGEPTEIDTMYLQKRYLRFISSAEFDKLIENPDTAISNKWKSYWWKRQGARSLRMKFNYKYPADTTQYALLRITELGFDNSDLNEESWRQKDLYHLIDTTIGQDQALEVRMLPGEGKLLRVNVLPPTDEINGSLEYSNQRKLVGYPIRNSNGTLNFDSLYYHLVFHKYDAGTGRMKIYYSRSKAVNKSTNYANIVWDTTLCVSPSIQCGCENGDTRQLYCGYPSIVVRNNGITPTVYIVYGCKSSQYCKDETMPEYPQIAIVETKFTADTNFVGFVPPTPRVITYVTGYDYAKWGTPMLGASVNGNFYTWADSLRGIGVGYKDPNDWCFDDTMYVKVGDLPEIQSVHPSVNSYPVLNDVNNKCGLVWNQFDTDNYPSGTILYSRINYINGNLGLEKFTRANNGLLFAYDSTILFLGIFYSYGYPSIYRGIEISNSPINDRVAWWSDDPLLDEVSCSPLYSKRPSIICYRGIRKFVNDSNNVGVVSRIYHKEKSSLYPSLSQGINWGAGSNLSDSAAILNFSISGVCDGSNPKIWHLPHNYSSFLFTYETNVDDIGPTSKGLLGTGDLPQLAARRNVDKKMWKNRRVFQRDSSVIDQIFTSSEGFYRGGGVEKPFSFIGYNNNRSKSIFSKVSLDNKFISYDFDWLYPVVCDTCPRLLRMNSRGQYPDTIPTKWFRLSSNDVSMSIKSFGNDTNVVKVFLERRNDRRQTKVNLSQLSDTDYRKHNIRLLNGRDNEYRLLLIRNSDSVEYSENIVIMPDEDDETFEKSSTNEIIILLNDDVENSKLNLQIYPNPAGNEIFVRTGNQNKKSNITYRLFNNLGSEILSVNGKSDEVLNISTSDLPQGIYFLKAESEFSEFEIKSLIIQR